MRTPGFSTGNPKVDLKKFEFTKEICMKARVASIAGLALLFASAVGAQTKVSGQHTCPKPPEVVGTAEAGDKAGHTLSIVKGTCSWTKPMEMAGEKSKDGTSIA